MTIKVDMALYVASFRSSALAPWYGSLPWELTSHASQVVRKLLRSLAADFRIDGEVAVHASSTVESGAVLKAPLIVEAGCFIAAGACLRGGNWVGQDCIVGPGTELKSSFVFRGTRLAHFNYVGDSILGCDVNLEAGSVICNHRDERAASTVRIRIGSDLTESGHAKFGALIGDGSRLGANSVVAPGALLLPSSIVGRASLFDAELRA